MEFGEKLAEHGIVQSLGRTGICYDNSMAESFFGKLKTELVHHWKFATRAEARRGIVRYIEGFYNRRRRHSALDYMSPMQFETTHPSTLISSPPSP